MELLLAIAVFAVIITIAGFSLANYNRRQVVDAAASRVSQDINRIRSEAMKSGRPYRLSLVDSQSYSLQTEVAGVWQTETTVHLDGVVEFQAPSTGGQIEFSPRGFASFSQADLVFTLSDGTTSKSVMPAMSGVSRIW